MDRRKNNGGARKGAGRKAGVGVSYDIQKYCNEFIIELLKDEAIHKKALRQVQGKLFEEEQESYVYLLKSGDLYKIGFASDWQKRKKSYDTHNPDYKLIFLYKGYDSFEVESFLHKKYIDKNVQGEWFDLSDDEILYLISYCSNLIS